MKRPIHHVYVSRQTSLKPIDWAETRSALPCPWAPDKSTQQEIPAGYTSAHFTTHQSTQPTPVLSHLCEVTQRLQEKWIKPTSVFALVDVNLKHKLRTVKRVEEGKQLINGHIGGLANPSAGGRIYQNHEFFTISRRRKGTEYQTLWLTAVGLVRSVHAVRIFIAPPC